MGVSIEAFVAELPKVELHVHLVGSASVPTVLELARRHHQGLVPTEEAELRRFYEFVDFPHFLDVYQSVSSLVTTAEDVTVLVVGLARDLAASNVRYAEVTVTPYTHLRAGIPPEDLADGLTQGSKRAHAEHGVELAWIFDIPGGLEEPPGDVTLAWTLRHGPPGTVGFGLGGVELDRALFAPAFATARASGLHSIPHAGEATGPESIWAALDLLGAERIGHGIAAARDRALLARLANDKIPLEVCPTSNALLKVVPSLAEHPLPRLLDAGVQVTLNTDDPGMFHTTLNREYVLAHAVFGLTRADLAQLARNAVRAAYCPPSLRKRLLVDIDSL